MEDTSNQITYVEEEKCYTYCTGFRGEGGSNKFLLFFNEKGDFFNIKSYVFYRSNELTLEETKTKQIKMALEEKGKLEKILKNLIIPKNKEKIRIIETRYKIPEIYEKSYMRECLGIEFELQKVEYLYHMDIENPLLDELLFTYENKDEWYGRMFPVKNIPSLKEVENYIRNHPTIRIKYVNELARHDVNLKRRKEENGSRSNKI